MGPGFAGALFIVLLIFTSGCTQTGRVVEENLTHGEELVLEEFLNETAGVQANYTNATGNAPGVYMGHTGPQNITQPLGCPETCDDGDNCTYDYCSGDTGYKCVHATLICPNTVRECPDGVDVICENACANDSCMACEPDCSEHQPPACGITQNDCGACQILDAENCACARIISCIQNDGCCPEGCNYTNDNNCEVPPGECSHDSECNDNNNCTADRCLGIPKACLHENVTACTSGDGCCPEGCVHANDTDCEEEEIFNITITYVNYTEEWVEIWNFGNMGVEMTNWTINDTLVTPQKRFTFPEFVLQPENHVYILKGYGQNNATHLYRNKNDYIWNDGGDTAVLIDNKEQTISQYSYGE